MYVYYKILLNENTNEAIRIFLCNIFTNMNGSKY